MLVAPTTVLTTAGAYQEPPNRKAFPMTDNTTTTIAPEVLARARAGLDWLEQVCPTEIDRVDLATLAMEDCEMCVVGQIFGDSSAASRVAHWAFGGLGGEVWMMSHGFMARSDVGYSAVGSFVEYASLTEAWRLLLSERKAVA